MMHIDKKQLGLNEEQLVLTKNDCFVGKKCDYNESTIANDESEVNR